MKRFEVHFEAGLTGPKHEAEARLDLIMEYLVDNGVDDPWVGLGPDKVEMTLGIEAENPESALANATQMILDAIRSSERKAMPPGLPGIEFELRKAELVNA